MIIQPEIIVQDDAAQVAHKGAGLLVASAARPLPVGGFFSLAVSGGSTPRPMHRMWAQEPYRSLVPWERIHLFWVDERCVPAEDPASNYGAALKDFVGHVPIPPDQVHPIPSETNPERGALSYERAILKVVGFPQGGCPSFDLVFLGLGEDGHVASLFPGDAAVEEKERLVVAVKGGEPNLPRLTLTLPVLNRAREIVFLVSGKGKAAVVKAVLENTGEGLPARRIQPSEGQVTWLLDREAASLLKYAGV